MHTRTTSLIAFLTVFTILGITLVLAQPSLTPPAGPIDESGRFGTLIELNDDTAPGAGVYAHVITTPGSYILTGDIDAGSGSGVEIRAADVTLDLNGYTIRGTGEDGVSVPEVTGTSPVETPGITLRNGNIVGFTTGVRAFSRGFGTTSSSDGVRLDDLQIRATRTGITARSARITDCAVQAPVTGIDADFSVIDGSELRLAGNTNAFIVAAIDTNDSTISRTVIDRSRSESSTPRGFDVSRTLVSASSVHGGGTGFALGDDSVANGCVSTAASNFVGASAATFNSNF
mgnify:CR=1 FL=1